MRKFLFLTLIMGLFFPPAYSFGFSGKGEDCLKCHTLKKDEAMALLKDIIPNLKVLDIKAAPFRSFWEVDVDSGGKKSLIYIDVTKKFMFYGSLINIQDKRDLTKERLADLTKVDVSKVPLNDALVLGDKTAKNKVIVFDDPD